MNLAELKQYIVDVPDYPRDGVVFKDITPVLSTPRVYKYVIDCMAEEFKDAGIDLVIGIEARGFFFAGPLALKMHKGFIPVRKPGKLPRDRISESYALEYGFDALELHSDAISAGQSVILVDDVLATGGTVSACAELVRRLGGTVAGYCFLMELEFLGGRDKLRDERVFSLLQYS